MSAPKEIGRIAFRREGAVVNCYWAETDTMVGATLIGSIAVSVCDTEPEIWERFKELMCDAFSGIVRRAIGQSPGFTEERPAPEHERAGRA